MRAKLSTIAGEPSWVLRSDTVELAVTRRSGHLAPVTFDRRGRRIRPFHVSPFASRFKGPSIPPILKVLRGDFFCLPFGGNAKPCGRERHLPHGETANANWRFVSTESRSGTHTLTLEMPLRVRRGHVTKRVSLRDGENVIYQEHVVRGMEGLNCPGHHPNLEFRSRGHIAISRFLWGSTYPWLMLAAENQFYSGLKPGFGFRRLGKAPLIYGGESDLSVYPARRGFTDVVQVVADPRLPVAWNTVTFPEEGWLYFALRDPRVLRQTVLWFSNGGTYYPPWEGRHLNVLGIEDVTSFFAEGLPISARSNAWTRRGAVTALRFSKEHPTTIRYIMGVARVPRGFKRVKDARFERDRVVFLGSRGRAEARVDWNFVRQ